MLGIEVRTSAATALAARSCAATPRQSAAKASCFSISNTRIWSAVVSAEVRLPARAAGSPASMRRRLSGLIARTRPSVSVLTPHLPMLPRLCCRSSGNTILPWTPLSSGARRSECSFTLAPTTIFSPPSASGAVAGGADEVCAVPGGCGPTSKLVPLGVVDPG